MKAIAILGILMLIGIPALFFMGGASFDVSPEARLGRFEAMDAWLAKREFIKNEYRPTRTEYMSDERWEKLEKRYSGVEAFRYISKINAHWAGSKKQYNIELLKEPDGRVREVKVRYNSQLLDVDRVAGSFTEAFTRDLWIAVSGEHPIFQNENRDRLRVCRSDENGVRASWIKVNRGDSHRKFIVDSVVFVRK